MSRKLIVLLLLLTLSAVSVYAVFEVGYIGIFEYQFHSPAGWQVLVDLVVACLLLIIWLVPDARSHGKNPWPWVVMTLFLGSFGPLLYLLIAAPDKKITL